MTKLEFTCYIIVCLFSIRTFAIEKSYEQQNEELLYSISALHVDVRNSGIEGYKKKSGWTDDELSSRLLVLAEQVKNDSRPMMRDFVIGAIMDFGTTNALEYVENEAMHGPDFAAGLAAFALITGFDQRCFELADIVFAEKRPDTSRRKVSFYNFLCAASISGDEYYGRKITRKNQARIIEYLRKSAETADDGSNSLDEILLDCDPSYKDSETRKRNIRHMTESLPTNSVAYAYFNAERRKIDEDKKTCRVATEVNQLDENKSHLSNRVTVIFACSLFLIFVVIYLIFRKKT